MKRISLLLSIAGLLFLGSCSKETPEAEQTGTSAPRMIAEAGDALTKAGIVEDNADYINGEKFRWIDGDEAKVIFGNGGTAITYTAANPVGNRADFTPGAGDVSHATYDVYGLYPAAGWGGWNGTVVNMASVQVQTGTSSDHLSPYMFMKAKTAGFEHNGSNELHLSYKHLTSVLRFSVWNATGNNTLKLKSITVSTSSGARAFGTLAYLNYTDEESFIVSNNDKTASLRLETDGSFAGSNPGPVFDAFMAALPTGTFEATDNLLIDLLLSDGTNNYGVSKTLSFADAASFLAGGIQKGMSYYFKLKVDALTPLSGDVYNIGDVYPKSGPAEGIVYWLKPGSNGTQGKIVSLDQGESKRWGPARWDDGTSIYVDFVDEDNDGVAGIRSRDDGTTATLNLITKRKEQQNFTTDYAVWNWILDKNGADGVNGKWYLPAYNELRDLYSVYAVNRTGFNGKLTGAGGMGFSDWSYWSSSESDGLAALGVNFYNGNAVYAFKHNFNYVRAVSAF